MQEMEDCIQITAEFNAGIDRVLFPALPNGPRIAHDPLVRSHEVAPAIRKIMEEAPIPPNVALVYNLDALDSSISSLHSAFNRAMLLVAPQYSEVHAGSQFLHCFAVKSCPVSYILHRAVSSGLGLETASLNELRQSIRSAIIVSDNCELHTYLTYRLQVRMCPQPRHI
jgi:hypothetical protein